MDKRLCPICSRINQPQDTHCWFCNAELPPISAEELQNGDWLLDLQNDDILAAGENEDNPVEQAEEKVGKEDDENAPDWLSRIREREGAERAEKKASEERYWAEKKSHDGLPEWLRSLNEDAAENTINNSDAQMADETDQTVVPNSSAPQTPPASPPDDDWLESLKSWQPGEEETIANQKIELPIPLKTERIPAQSQSEPEVEKLGLEEKQADSVFDLNKIFSLAEEKPIEGPKSPLDELQVEKLEGEKLAPESGFDPERFFSFEENEPISEPDPLAEQPQTGELELKKLEPNPDLYPERFFSFNEDETASTKDNPNQQHEPIYTNTFQSLDGVFDEPEKPGDSESITQNQTGKEQLPFGLPDIPLDMAPIEPEKLEKGTPPHEQSKDWPYFESTAENQPPHESSRVEKQEPDSDFDPERFFSFDVDEPVSEPEPEQLQPEKPEVEKPEAEKPESNSDLYPERFFSFAGDDATSTTDKQPQQSEPVSTRMFQSLGDIFKESDKSVNPEQIEHLGIDNESLPFGLPEIPSDMAPIESEESTPTHDQPKDSPIVESAAEGQHLQGASQAENPESSPDLYSERFFSFVGDEAASISDKQAQLSEPVSTRMFQSLKDVFKESEKPVTPEQIEHLGIDKESLPFGLPEIPLDMVPIESEKADKDSPVVESAAEEQHLQASSQAEEPRSNHDLYPERFFSFAGDEAASTSDKQAQLSEPVSTKMFQSLGDVFAGSEKPVDPEQIEHHEIDKESLPFGLPDIPSDMAPIEPEKSEKGTPPHDQSKDTPIVESTAEDTQLQGASQAENLKPDPDLYPERFFSFVGDEAASTTDKQAQLSEPASTKMFQSLGDAFGESEKPVNPEQIEHLDIDKESLPFGLPDIPSDMVPIEPEKADKDSPFVESAAEDQPYQGISHVEGQSPFGSSVDSFQIDSEPTNELPKAAHAAVNDLNTDAPSKVNKNTVLPFDLGSSNSAEDPFKADSFSLDPFEPDDLPGWLADVKPVDKLDEKPDVPSKPKKTRIVIDDGSPKPERGKLPVWLASRRPVEALDLSSTIEGKASTSETSDLEQSIVGVAAGASDSALIEKSSGLERGLKISSRQKANATLLSVIATSLESTEETAKTAVPSGRLNVWRSLLALVFIAVSFLGATTLNSYYLQPALFPEEVAHTFNLVNSIPLDKPVLIAGDFDAGFAGEIRLTSQSIIEHLMRRDLNIALMAINPVDAALLTDQINKGLFRVPSYSSANKMVDLGYLPGGAIAVQNMGNSFVEAVPLTAEMVKVTANEITKNVQNLGDFGAIIVITDKSESARVWIEQIQPTLGDTPLLMVTSAQASPLILPYYQSGQVDGLVSGMAGGMIYEQILGSSSGAGRNAASLQLLSVLMASLVLIGGFTSLVNPKSGWRKR